MIEVEGLTKRYGRQTAVDGVSFRVQKGEILGFLGPNGAGKTTTMRILTCYLPPTEGTARVAGYDVFENPIEAKKHIGYLPETPPLYPDMEVRGYLDFVAKIKGVPAKDRKSKVDDAIEKCRVGDVRATLIGKLSKGYRQRVGLAQSILHNPDVLILDEPTAGLDPKQIIETRELIKGLGGEHTVILSTHILHEVSVTCGRVVIISKGHVVAEDTPENLTHRLRGAGALRLEVRGASGAVFDVLRTVPGVLNVQPRAEGGPDVAVFDVDAQAGKDVRADLARAVVQKGFDLLGLSQVGMGLEEIFLHLTTTDAAADVSQAAAPGEVIQ
jgi:gliding motility-associated transport system ATP-binding protein